MSEKIIEKLRFLSKQLNRGMIALPNYIDDTWEYYVFVAFVPKTSTMTNNSFEGICITNYIKNTNMSTFDPMSFARMLETADIESINFGFDTYYWIQTKGV